MAAGGSLLLCLHLVGYITDFFLSDFALGVEGWLGIYLLGECSIFPFAPVGPEALRACSRSEWLPVSVSLGPQPTRPFLRLSALSSLAAGSLCMGRPCDQYWRVPKDWRGRRWSEVREL